MILQEMEIKLKCTLEHYKCHEKYWKMVEFIYAEMNLDFLYQGV